MNDAIKKYGLLGSLSSFPIMDGLGGIRRFCALAIALVSMATQAAEPPRERLLLDPGWRFAVGAPDIGGGAAVPAGLSVDFSQSGFQMGYGAFAKAGGSYGNAAVPSAPDFDDLGWRRVDLPHDWAVEMPFSEKADCLHGSKTVGPPFMASSVAWYRRPFEIPATDDGRHISIEFDGVFRDAEFYCNGHYLGRNFSGYAPVSFDLTPYLKYGDTNVLAVRVNATSFEGWFYEGAGIYRHVWLVKTAPVHVPQWGIYARSSVEGDPSAPVSADVVANTTVRNDSDADVLVKVRARLLDKTGKEVASAVSVPEKISAGKDLAFPVNLHVAAKPCLWSTSDPYLYTVESSVLVDDKVTDCHAAKIGIRTIRWDAAQGFFLNGVRTFLKGTCNHQDHAGLGAALPDRVIEWRIERLIEMGCNAIRTSHNPPTPELLDACDRLGVLVMDETRMVGATDEALSQLERMIRRDRNHPSVIIWSLGNEEMGIQKSETGARILTPMQRLAHELDPTRPTTIAMNGNWGSGFSDVVDVQGGNYLRLGGGFDNFHKKFPNKPVVGTEEASHTTARGNYTQDECNADEAKAQAQPRFPNWASTAESWIKHYTERPYLAGGFAWTGFDNRGEPFPKKWPSINSYFGIMDNCGFPKDVYYYYLAQWTDKPVLHLLPHWNWPDKIGQPVEVRCDGNAEEVELFLNGVSQGRKPMPKLGHLDWIVTYQPGKLQAKGFGGGKQVSETTVETTGTPTAIHITPDRATIHADGKDVAMFTVAVVDAQGRVMPTAGNKISFKLDGPGQIIGVGNGDPTCHEADKFIHPAPSLLSFNWTSKVTTNAAAEAALADNHLGWEKASTDGKLLAKGQTGIWRGIITLQPEQVGDQDFQVSMGKADGKMKMYWNGRPISTMPPTNGNEFTTIRLPAGVVGTNILVAAVTATGEKGGLLKLPRLVLTANQSLPWQRSAFNGLAQIIVQSRREPGTITLTASADGLDKAEFSLSSRNSSLVALPVK